MSLERMDAFFDARVAGYDRHMLEEIVGASEFYPLTAEALPQKSGLRLLDLGCGTGLELDELFLRVPDARVTGVDLSEGMLARLREKHPDRSLRLIRDSYFDVDFGEEAFDAAVSVESLHHFTRERKVELYRKILRALKSGGVYVETDYVAPDDAYEAAYFAECERLRAEAGFAEGEAHYDTPHTVSHLLAMREEAGFVRSARVWQKENTAMLVAYKP